MYTEFWWGNLRERDHFENPGVYRKILKWIFTNWDGGGDMGWIDLAQNREEWRNGGSLLMR